jgi:hypothetical protein
MSNRDRDVEILALRHQITVLERHLGNESVRFAAGDRAFLAALLHRLPRDVLRSLRLPVRPDTVLAGVATCSPATTRPRYKRGGRRFLLCAPTTSRRLAASRRVSGAGRFKSRTRKTTGGVRRVRPVHSLGRSRRLV